jgi:hypothetical protein
LLWLVMLGVHGFVGFAGVGLWRGTRRGLHLSLLAQAIQVPWIGTAHVTYRLGVGAAYWVASQGGAFTHERAIGSSFLIEMRQGFGAWVDQTPLTLGVNLVALAAGVFLVYTAFAKTVQAEPPSSNAPSR